MSEHWQDKEFGDENVHAVCGSDGDQSLFLAHKRILVVAQGHFVPSMHYRAS